MHILLFGLGDLYSIGGVQISYQYLLHHLAKKGHQTTFYSHREYNPNRAYAYSFPSSTSIHHYELRDTPEARSKIREITRKIDPDVVLIVNSGQASLPILSALHDLPYPVVLSERGSDTHNLVHNWFSTRQRAIAHELADFSHFLLPSFNKALPFWMNDRIKNIPSLIEPSRIGYASPSAPDRSRRFRLMYAGRLAFEKDVDLLIEAFCKLCGSHPDWDLHIFGSGPDEEKLRQQALQTIPPRSRGSMVGRILRAISGDDPKWRTPRVIFHGAQSQQRVLGGYVEAHLFALPSRAEGCPLALREAMAHGLPVVGFDDCTGVNEIIKHGENGLLAQSTDKIAGLADVLHLLMSDADRRVEMGRQGIKDVKRYSPAKVLNEWERLLVDASQYRGKRAKLRKERSRKPASRSGELLHDYAKMRAAGKHLNVFLFDPDHPLNRLHGFDLKHYAILFGSPFFDIFSYGKHHPSIKLSASNPLAFYLSEGYLRDWNPAPLLKLEGCSGTSVPPLVQFYIDGLPAEKLADASDLKSIKFLERERKRAAALVTALERPLNEQALRSLLQDLIVWRPLRPQHLVNVPLAKPPRRRLHDVVSIVIPVYNDEQNLISSIRSAQAQTYPNIEIIAVDDGSTDRSTDHLATLSAQISNLKIVSQPNGGLSTARNTGLRNASGKYVLFHDSDDVLEPDAISSLVAAATRSKADITGGVFCRVRIDGSRIVSDFRKDELITSFRKDIGAATLHSTNFSSCNKLFRRAFLEDNKLFFQEGLYMQDIEFWLRAMFICKRFQQTEAIVGNYIDRGQSGSQRRTPERFNSLFSLFDYLENFYNENRLDDYKCVRDYAFIQGALNFFLVWKLEEGRGDEASEDLIKLQELLLRIPEEHFVRFYQSKNKGPIAPLALLVRKGEWKAARNLNNNRSLHRQNRKWNQNLTADDFVRHYTEQV